MRGVLRWDESETHKFVKIYLGQNILWNPAHENYKVQSGRKEAYRTIITKFQAATNIALSEIEVRTKIKNLRATYNLEIAKIKQRSRPDNPYVSSLVWFADWNRCFGGLTKYNIKEESSSENQEANDSQKVWVPTDSNDEESNDKPPFATPDNDYVLLLKCEPEEKQETCNTPKTRKRKFKRRRSPSTDISEHNFTDSVDSNLDIREDEFDIYGKYIASQLRGMNLARALRVQLEIQSLVSEARIEHISERQSMFK